jgi:hypothetical protein
MFLLSYPAEFIFISHLHLNAKARNVKSITSMMCVDYKDPEHYFRSTTKIFLDQMNTNLTQVQKTIESGPSTSKNL